MPNFLPRKLPFDKIFIILFISLSLLYSANNSLAQPKKLPVPRFVTIKFDEVNARTGASKDCPIEWVFLKKGEPVQVVAEFEQWRKIRDIDNQGGWVHASTISGNRSIIIISKELIFLYSRPKQTAHSIAKLAPNLRCKLHKCQDEWCQITCKSLNGWVEKKYLWGV